MKVEPELVNHPKYLRLKKAVGDGALEHLIRIWGHCETSRRGEYWRSADVEYLEIVAHWHGAPGLLFEQLRSGGWIVQSESGIRIHDWNDTNWRAVTNWKLGDRPKHKLQASQKPRLKPEQTTSTSQGISPLSELNEMNEVNELPEGKAVEIPSESDVEKSAEGYPGDPSRGIPPVIPAGWALAWFAWRCSPSAGPFPSDWQEDMRRRFRAAWVNGDARTRKTEKKGATTIVTNGQSPAQARFLLDRELSEVTEAIEACRQAGAPPDAADLEREKNLRKKLAELQSV